MDINRVDHELHQIRSNTGLLALTEKRSRDKVSGKTSYRVKMTAEKAAKAREKARASLGEEYDRKAADVQRHGEDMKREQVNEDHWYQKEQDFKKSLDFYRTSEDAVNNNIADPEQIRMYQSTTAPQIEQWIEEARERRIKAGTRKNEFSIRKTQMEKALENMIENSGSNHIRLDNNGQPYKHYNAAPSYILQTFKRKEEEVARDVVQMLCSAEKLKSLDMGIAMKLFKEYKECYTNDDEMWDILERIMDNLETNKTSMTRAGLADASLPCLNIEMQVRHHHAMNSAKDTYKKEMAEVASFSHRKKREDQKINRSGKQNSHKGGKPHDRNNTRFNNSGSKKHSQSKRSGRGIEKSYRNNKRSTDFQGGQKNKGGGFRGGRGGKQNFQSRKQFGNKGGDRTPRSQRAKSPNIKKESTN